MADAADVLREAAEVHRRARRVLASHEVDAIMRRMAADIRARLGGSNPVVVAVMHGGVFTAVELCKHFDFPYEFAYVHVGRYGHALSGGEVEWHVKPQPRLAGRTILLVDDILDRGLTLAALESSVRALGVGDVRKAVFVVKDLDEPTARPRVDFVGCHVEDVYVFGCGMDYKGYWRGLPELLAAPPEPGRSA